MSTLSKILLWVDDDGSTRFPFEQSALEDAGWEVQWAEDAFAAASALAKTNFGVLLLDQLIPFDDRQRDRLSTSAVWGGCLLLYWLRGRQPPRHAPTVRGFSSLYELTPLAENQDLHVVVISAFYDEEVAQAMCQASPMDASLKSLGKPVDIERLLAALEART